MTQDSRPLDLAEATAALQATINAVRTSDTIALTDARHRVLAEPQFAPVNMPPFAASAMDGYAVRLQDFKPGASSTFQLTGTSWAGQPYTGTVGPGQAVRVFTGAVVPEGADQVLLQEEVEQLADDQVAFKPHTVAEPYVRHSGHDVQAGQRLLEAGTLLTDFHLGLLSSCGIGEVAVYQQPIVGVFSTGDELVDVDTAPDQLKAGQIYDSNRLTVLSLLTDLPFTTVDLGRLADDEAEVRDAIETHAAHCDVLVTSGGVSVGDADFVTSTIQALGELKFWKLNLKPGKPLAYGQINSSDHRCHIFGLPGNPVSTIVTLLLVARPAMLHLAGVTSSEQLLPLRVPAVLQDQVKHTQGRAEYQRGHLTQTEHGLTVTHTGDQSSNRLSTFAYANCLIEVPKEADDLAPNTQVLVLPFRGLL